MNKLKHANPHFTICTCVLIVSVQVVYVFQWNLYFGSVNFFFCWIFTSLLEHML